MYLKLICFLSLLFTAMNIDAQDAGETHSDHQELAFELQVYPTGIIPGLRYEHFMNEKWSWNLRVAGQIIDHRDLGKNDDETGSGYGGSIGVERYFRTGNTGFSLGLRNDVWLNTIDWEDDVDGVKETGTTDIVVLQPTAIAEYHFELGNISISPSLAFGFEWNVKTDGRETGEGAILLVGIAMGYRW